MHFFLTIIFWGSSFPFITYSLTVLSPMELAFSRFFLPASLSVIYICFNKTLIKKEDIINQNNSTSSFSWKIQGNDYIDNSK